MITTYIMIILFLGILILTMSRFIFDAVSHKRKMKAINNWRKLIDQSVKWSKEISCSETKEVFLEFYTKNMLKWQSSEITIKNINKLESEMLKKFGNHIPSLRKELRDSKLKDLGI